MASLHALRRPPSLVVVALLASLVTLTPGAHAASNADNYFCRACGVVMEFAHKTMLQKADFVREHVTVCRCGPGCPSGGHASLYQSCSDSTRI
jgi:hypothetical protein